MEQFRYLNSKMKTRAVQHSPPLPPPKKNLIKQWPFCQPSLTPWVAGHPTQASSKILMKVMHG